MTIHIEKDRDLIRAGARSVRYVLVRVNAPRAPRLEQRLPVNVSIVLDRSGSMQSERKFGLARDAVQQALRMLREEDRFSLVVYDTEIDVLTASTLATASAQRRALAKLDNVGPRGGTDLGGGWLRGCEQVAEFADGETVNRCLLLTDGLANHGITDRGELARHAAELRRRGVVTSTFGVGADFDERLLRDMAHEGGGNFYFIEGASQIPEILTGELGEALEITLRDASLVVHGNNAERVEPLNRFRYRPDRARDSVRIELGDLTSGQELDVVLRVEFNPREVDDTARIDIELHSAGEPIHEQGGAPQWTYASHADNDAQPRNRNVDRIVAELYAARARAEATEANRDGRYDHARRALEGTARRIRGYAGEDLVLNDVVAGLGASVHEYAETHMSAVALKMSTRMAEAMVKGRDSYGRARKR